MALEQRASQLTADIGTSSKVQAQIGTGYEYVSRQRECHVKRLSIFNGKMTESFFSKSFHLDRPLGRSMIAHVRQSVTSGQAKRTLENTCFLHEVWGK